MKRERHPINPGSGGTIEQRLLYLENLCAEMWDQLWWLSLPWYRRFWYRLPRLMLDSQYNTWIFWPGHSNPIRKFYDR